MLATGASTATRRLTTLHAGPPLNVIREAVRYQHFHRGRALLRNPHSAPVAAARLLLGDQLPHDDTIAERIRLHRASSALGSKIVAST